jgi:hypothetical protein
MTVGEIVRFPKRKPPDDDEEPELEPGSLAYLVIQVFLVLRAMVFSILVGWACFEVSRLMVASAIRWLNG